MPETPEYVEPPTAKNIFIGKRRLGKGIPVTYRRFRTGEPWFTYFWNRGNKRRE